MQRAHPQDWWRVTRMDDGISLIDEPHILPFYRCNCWHIRGADRDLLVDSGMGVVSLRDWVPLVTEKPLTAVASHTHFDHIGCHHEFDDCVIHSAEAHLLAAPTRENTFADKYVTDAIFDGVLPPEPYRSEAYTVLPSRPARIVEDGDTLDTGDRRFEVIHTPGHSPGGIALWEAATETLISGDIVYDGPLIESDDPQEMVHYIASMKRLLTLPVRTVHGGHFPSFSGDRLRRIITDWLRARGV
jgi:glyoxylase-like metal-dependent hydrolase (beta-lactamase superfamily II)